MLSGRANTLTDEQLVAFRNATFASAPIIMDIGIALILLAYLVQSWPLLIAGVTTMIIGIIVPLTMPLYPISVLERRRKGQWFEDDTLSLIRAISWTFPIGFVIGILILVSIPVRGESSSIERLTSSFILAVIAGLVMWIAFRFVMNELKRTRYKMEKKFDLSFEDALKMTEDIIKRIGGSVSKIERNPLLGKVMRAEFSTKFGMLRIRRIPPKKTMMEMEESQDWRILADLLDETTIKLQLKK